MLNYESGLTTAGYDVNRFSDGAKEIIFLDSKKPKGNPNNKNKDCSHYLEKENKVNSEKNSNAVEKNNDLLNFLLSILSEEIDVKLINKFLQITELITVHKNERIEVSPKSIYIIYNGDLTIQTEFSIKEIPKILSKNASIVSKNITYSLVSIENSHFFTFPKINSRLYLKSKKKTVLLIFPKSNFFYICEEKYSLYTEIKARLAEFNRLIEDKYCECYKNFKEKIKNMNSIDDLSPNKNNKSGILVKKKGKKRNVIRASVPNIYEKCKIIKDILGKSRSKDFIFTPNNFTLDKKIFEKKSEVKVLQIPSKNGISFRAREVDSTNLTDLKQKFFPLSFNQIVFKNKRKLIPSEPFTIKDTDPFKWGKEICLFQNEERNCLNRLYTRKLPKSRNQSSFISELNSVNYHVELEKNSNFSSEKVSDSINNKRFSLQNSNDINNKILSDESSHKKYLLPRIIEMHKANSKKKEKLKKTSNDKNGEEDENDQFTHRIYEKKLEGFGKCGGYLVQKIKRSK